MIIRKIWPLANDHPEGLAICKWSSGGSGPLQMIIQRILPLANDHPVGPPLPPFSRNRTYLKIWVLVSHWTCICPSLFKCVENTFFTFCDFQTLCPWFSQKYDPASTPSSYCIVNRVIKDTGASYWTKYILCNGSLPPVINSKYKAIKELAEEHHCPCLSSVQHILYMI